jgi:hypothetical protein
VPPWARRQAVRLGILIPASAGSNPAAPAIHLIATIKINASISTISVAMLKISDMVPSMVKVVEILAQIRADKPVKFTAGIVLWDDKVIEAAPIVGYMKGWSRARVRYYVGVKRKWDITVIHQVDRYDTRYKPD